MELDSENASSAAVTSIVEIRLERDYSIRTPRFFTDYPEVLRGLCSQEEFRNTVDTINYMLEEADDYSREAFCWELLNCLSLFSLNCFCEPRAKQIYRDMESYLTKENEDFYLDRGIKWISPVKTGLLFIEILVKTTGKPVSTTSSPSSASSTPTQKTEPSSRDDEELLELTRTK